MKKIMMSTLAFAALAAVGCSSSSKTDSVYRSTASANEVMDAKVATKMDAPYFTEVEFGKGETTLTEADRQKIINTVTDARNAGVKIDDVKVITWADAEYPTTGQGKLSKEQQKLVERRNKHVKDIVKTAASNVDVDVYNMAERPNTLQKWLNTSDAKIKKSFETAGLPTTESGAKMPAKASKSVIMVITE